MYPVFNIFGIEIPAYGAMVSIGVLCLVGVMFYFFKKNNVSDAKIDRLIVCTAIGGFAMYLSAAFFDALWHNLENWHQTGVFTWEWYGITFSGGLVGGILAYIIAYWFCFKTERHNIIYYFNFIITGVVIAHAFGRIGCYLAGCCYGKETTSFLGVYYPVKDFIGGVYKEYAYVYPTQLFESGFLFILFLILFFVVKKNQLRYYLISYGIFRFILEFFRGDSRGNTILGFLSPSQFLSIIMVIFGILLWIFEDKLVTFIQKKFDKPLNIPQQENEESVKENNLIN